jgi:uncharacterized membrane protein
MFGTTLNFLSFLRSGCVIVITLLFGLTLWLQHINDKLELKLNNLNKNVSICNNQISSNKVQDKIDAAYNQVQDNNNTMDYYNDILNNIPDTFIEIEENDKTNKKDKNEKSINFNNGTFGSFKL